jgi:hypothetical protein
LPYNVFPLRPIEHGISTENSALFIDPAFAPWIQNCRCDKGSIEKCWGYSVYRTLGRPVYSINLYPKIDGSRYTLYLTDTDLISKEDGSGKTWAYKTDSYTTSTVASMDGNKLVITGTAGTNWNTAGLAAGDKFIIDADFTADEEPSTKWATILTVDGATQITLAAAYTGSSTSGAYRIRKVMSLPSNERWSTSVVNNIFCFTNGNINVQKYTGTGYASDLNATYAQNARYCMEYANRLIIADIYQSGIRLPLTFMWSKEGDPTDWTDTTAGEADILETEDYITGLGRVGGNMVVFKRDSLHFYTRTGNATDPFSKIGERRGVGNIAPYSIANFLGTCAFLGRDDFYIINGDQPESIGEKIRDKFFSMVEPTEAQNVWAYANHDLSEIMWFANTTTGRYVFVYNFKDRDWYVYSYPDEILCAGIGAV